MACHSYRSLMHHSNVGHEWDACPGKANDTRLDGGQAIHKAGGTQGRQAGEKHPLSTLEARILIILQHFCIAQESAHHDCNNKSMPTHDFSASISYNDGHNNIQCNMKHNTYLQYTTAHCILAHVATFCAMLYSYGGHMCRDTLPE